MRLKMIIIGLLLSLSALGYSQTVNDIGKIVLGVRFIDGISRETQNLQPQLEDKLILFATQSGYSSFGNSMFFISPNIVVNSIDVAEGGMKNVYVVKGELYLAIQDEMNGTVYLSASFPFIGSATQKNDAIKSAIVNINYGKVQGFFKEAKEKILAYYRQQMDVVFHRAETCAENGNYDEAIACLMMIPEELSDLHIRALQKAKEIYDQRDMAIRQREIAQRFADNDSILAEANSLIGMHNPQDALKTLWDYRPGTEQQDKQYAALVKKAKSLVSAAEVEALRKEERNYQDEKQKEVREWNEYTKETAHQRDMDRREMQLKSQVAASAERVAHHRLDVDAQTVDALKTIACEYLRNKKIFVNH